MKKSTQLVPAFASTLLARIALSVGVSAVAIGITSAVLPQPTLAQSVREQPLGEFTNPQNERDSLSGNIGGSNISIFDLMHRAQQGNVRDVNDFMTEKRQDLDNAAEVFRRTQLEQLGNQQQVSPANSVTTSPRN
jgi:hypothetical protein